MTTMVREMATMVREMTAMVREMTAMVREMTTMVRDDDNDSADRYVTVLIMTMMVLLLLLLENLQILQTICLFQDEDQGMSTLHPGGDDS